MTQRTTLRKPTTTPKKRGTGFAALPSPDTGDADSGKCWQSRMKRFMVSHATVVVPSFSVTAGVVIWAVATSLSPSPIMPTPLEVLESLFALMVSGTLIHDAAVSLQRIVVGFILGCAVGIPLGLAMGLFRTVRAIFDPIVQFLRFVPPIAWLIPAIIWFGTGETSKVLIIFYMTVFLVLLNTMSGVSAMRLNYIRAAQSYEIKRWQLFMWIVVPATMSYSVAGARIALGNSFAAVVGAELIGASAGLGFRIIDSGKWMAMGDMFGVMLVLGLLGIAADQIVNLAASRYLGRFLTNGDHEH
ncbi:MAG: ABC transporter permease [Candidimonas sp.]|nr:MAG: ABC transporter permease [Candidimonas sp.]TAM22756.1 MAG: ABC transporter permease [Candidimonas sp.]